MSRIRTILITTMMALTAAAGSAAAVPGTMSFTARLSEGDAPVEGNVSLHVAIYDATTGGTLLWEETHATVTADHGLVYANLGSIDPVNNSLDGSVFGGQTVYAELTVNGDVLSPRIPLTSVPYAVRAGTAETLEGFDPGTVQRRVTGVCGANTFVTGVNADGTVACGTDGVGTGDITAVTAGTGLSGGGASGPVTLSVNTTVVQSRVTGVCTVGSSIRQVNADGTVLCQTDGVGTGDITGVTAGNGLTGGGTANDVTLSVNTTVVQARVTGVCNAGTFVTAVSATGAVTCGNDAVGGIGDITAVNTAAGSGLAGGNAAGDVALSIAAGGVTTAMLADGAVNSAKIADSTVASGDILNGTVATADIAAGAVTMSKTDTPSGWGSAVMANGAQFVFPSTATTAETAGSCMVTAQARYVNLTNQGSFRVRPIVRNAAGTSFVQTDFGYSHEWEVAGITGDPQFPNGFGQGREATATSVVNVTGAGPWTFGCEIQGGGSAIRCIVSYLCN
ncbi:MAG TPA: hypothetical protein VM261_12895 [Kofleriaceae bacterium]|nr:hypothetical protein [Kofleriaceae bacterium]